MSVVNLEEQSINTTTDSTKYGTEIQNMKGFSVGSGEKTAKIDDNGLFMGASNFSSAPFNVDYEGNMNLSAGGNSIPWSDVQAGTNANTLNVGVGNVKIDGSNKRIIINDGTNDRVLIGYLAGKF